MENIQDIYPLSPMQEGMLFHTIYAPDSEVYKEQFSCRLFSDLNLECFKSAWEEIINRHDILRSAFVWEDVDEPLQVVQTEVKLPFQYEDISSYDEGKKNIYITESLAKNQKLPFDFSIAPLMRIFLIRVGRDEYFLIWDHHHILFDGWGLPVLIQEMMSIYSALTNGRQLNLNPTFPYKNYIAWIKKQNEDEAKIFWHNKLKGFLVPTKLILPSNKIPEIGYAKKRILIPELISETLLKLAKEEQITINTIMQAAWSLVLSYYTNENDVVFGATVSGRNAAIPGIDKMVGLFINTLPVRAKIDFNRPIVDWLKEFQLEQSSLQEYEYSSLFKIQQWSDIPKGESLFNSILVVENYPIGEALEKSEQIITITDVRTIEKTNYPLTIVISPGKTLGIEIAYDTLEFDKSGIDELFKRLTTILKRFSQNLSNPISSINFITEDESNYLPRFASGEQKREVAFTNIVDWFQDVVVKNGSTSAVVCQENNISFRELNKKANQIANYLIENSISYENIIGVCLDRSIDMVSTILGINKIGAVALPIDSGYPVERINYIVEDSNLELLITTDSISNRIKNNNISIVDIDSLNNILKNFNNENIIREIFGENLSYIIYTSGSTGKPKGVCLKHNSLCNFVNNTIVDFNYSDDENILQFSSFGFDAAIGEIFSSLLSGGTLYIPDREVTLSTEDLICYINNNKITFTYLPPSYLSLVDPAQFHSSLRIASVGDKCSLLLAEKWGKNLTFYNGYGPTETTIGATFHKYDNNSHYCSSIPIGKSFGNTVVYILDKYLRLAPIGVPGEIYVGGDGVGRGYLSKPDITAEKYLPDTYSEKPGARMYKTGDLAMLCPDGNIEFIGRKDFQVKLRGYRIELNEIESVLHSHVDVSDCAVLAIKEENGDEYLVAYVIPSNNVIAEDILNYLGNELPSFMIPNSITFLKEFPLTPNKKLDRNKLPKPATKKLNTEYLEPKSTTEKLVANIWSDILKIERVSTNSNFFELGGHSLLATQLISRLRDAFKKEIPFTIVFDSRDLNELCNRIDNEHLDINDNSDIIQKADRSLDLPLSYSQQRLWFLDRLKPNDPSYNIPTVLRLKGSLKIEFIEKALNLIIDKHEILRTSFNENNGKPFQKITSSLKIAVNKVKIDEISTEHKIAELKDIIRRKSVIPFNLEELPLIRCELYELEDDDYVLFLLVHHIISDGWSLSIIVKEFVNIYVSLLEKRDPELKELDIQFADYAKWQKMSFEKDNFTEQLGYWKSELKDAPPLLELPYDKPKPNIQTNNSKRVSLEIEADLIEKLIVITRSENSTLFMTMLSIFQIVLSKYSNMNDIVVGTPIAGRTSRQIEDLVGFFVNNLAIRTKIDGNISFRDFLNQTRDKTIAAFANQVLPFDKIVEELQPVRDLSHQPIFQVMFVFQNIPFDNNDLGNLKILPFDIEAQTTNFDLTVTLQENDNKVSGALEYNSDLFEESTMVRFAEHLKLITKTITIDPDIEIEDILVLTDNEKELTLNRWNKNKSGFGINENVVQRFEKEVLKNSKENALIYKTNTPGGREIQLDYSNLNKKINQLANFIISKGLHLEDRIAICLPRHEDMIISMFAIMKAGAAFVPIDPSLPIDRINFMLDSVDCKLIIINNEINSIFKLSDDNIVNLDKESDKIISYPETDIEIDIDLANLAYVIFTSGSTGLPKGVMLSHKGLTNLAEVQKEAFNISNEKRVMQFSSLSFDASVWETVMALLNGASLYLSSQEVISSGQELSKYLIENKITTITLPPSVLTVLPIDSLPYLDTLITAGESVSNDLVRKWQHNREYFNAYGPTETTVCATMFNPEYEYPKGPPIGSAISNFETYIIDSNLQPVGIGIPGELCVGGIGLARGYIKRPDLTAERFIPNMFTTLLGERLYRTGDLAKYLPDGNIEFLGRIDSQVKLRGFRIEIGEIEHNLKQIQFITDAVVVVAKNDTMTENLVAYVVSSEVDFGKERIVLSLKDKLPDYMIPTIFFRLDKMPLTNSGKINKSALPKPTFSREDLGIEYVAPRNDSEEKLVIIVQNLLSVDKAGVKDNFFELGGHSLLATQFISRIRDEFNTEIKLIKLFEEPTIEGVIKNIDSSKKELPTDRPTISKVSRESRRIRRTDIS